MVISNRAKRWSTQIAAALLGTFFSVFLGWLALQGTEWAGVWEELTRFPVLLLIAALFFVLLSGYIRAVRWRLLWQDNLVTTFRLYVIENAALGLNIISPIRSLDEPLQFGILVIRDRLPGGTVAATMIMNRVQDLAFTIVFIGVAVATQPVLLRFTPAVVVTTLFLAIWLGIILNLNRIIPRIPLARLIPGVESFEQAVDDIWSQKRRVIFTYAITCTYWVMLGPAGWLIARGVGIDLPFFQILVVVLGAIFFATSVPGLPGALGTFEYAVIFLLGLFGAPEGPSVTFAIILHIVLFVPPAIFAIIVLPREGVASIRSLVDIMSRGRETKSTASE